MKVIVTADLHLHPWRECSADNGADRLQDGLSALRQTLHYAQDRGVPWVFLGDAKHLQDRWVLAALNGALEVLDEFHRVSRVLVPGNHDGLAGGGSGLRPFCDRDKSMVVLERPGVYDLDGLGTVAVWPWARSYEIAARLLAKAKATKARVLLAHAFLSGAAVGPDGLSLKRGATLADFGLAGAGRVFDWGLFGDVHVRQWSVGGTWQVNSLWDESKGREWKKKRAFTVFPGSPAAQTWGEREPDKGCLYVDTDAMTVEVLPVKAPRFIVDDWTACRDVNAALSAFADGIPVDGVEAADWGGHFVRILVPPGADKALIARVREASGARAFQAVTVAPARPAERRSDIHAGLSSGELLSRYVKARPPENLPAASVLSAGLKLLNS